MLTEYDKKYIEDVIEEALNGFLVYLEQYYLKVKDEYKINEYEP